MIACNVHFSLSSSNLISHSQLCYELRPYFYASNLFWVCLNTILYSTFQKWLVLDILNQSLSLPFYSPRRLFDIIFLSVMLFLSKGHWKELFTQSMSCNFLQGIILKENKNIGDAERMFIQVSFWVELS